MDFPLQLCRWKVLIFVGFKKHYYILGTVSEIITNGILDYYRRNSVPSPTDSQFIRNWVFGYHQQIFGLSPIELGDITQ